jgi:hypothetical protein
LYSRSVTSELLDSVAEGSLSKLALTPSCSAATQTPCQTLNFPQPAVVRGLLSDAGRLAQRRPEILVQVPGRLDDDDDLVLQPATAGARIAGGERAGRLLEPELYSEPRLHARHGLAAAWCLSSRCVKWRGRGSRKTRRVSHARRLNYRGEERLVALILLVLLLALILGGLGFAIHIFWWIALIVLVIWILGFLVRVGEGSRRGRWYRW